jgi:epoxyqueuosine reductase
MVDHVLAERPPRIFVNVADPVVIRPRVETSPAARRSDRGDTAALWARIETIAQQHDLLRVAVTSSAPFEASREDLIDRKARGLNADMQFTYRNPVRSTDPSVSLPSARSVIVAACSYRQTAELVVPGRPIATVARYATSDYYEKLRLGLEAIRSELKSEGYKAVVACDSNALVDRAAAYRAGIGWWGRNTNLIIDGFGSWFVLGNVITDAAFERVVDSPDERTCGSCRSCIPACPTGALGEQGELDAGKCLAWLLQAGGSIPLEFRAAVGDRLYGCDECQEVCPPNRVVDRRTPADPPGRDPGPVIDAVAVLRGSDAELTERFGRWYFAGRDLNIWRRNALVVLGNWLAANAGAEPHAVGSQPTPAAAQRADVRSLLATFADGSDELLGEHARWALERKPDHPGRAAQDEGK